MDNEYKSGQEGAPMIFRVLKAAGTTGGEKVYVGNPVRVLNEEAEGIDLQYDYDSSITVPFTLLSSAGLATGDLMIGLPIAGRMAALGGSGAQVAGIVTGCGLFPAVKAVVEIQPAGGGTPYATLTADDHGHYSGTVPIPVSGTYRFVTKPHATDEPYAARFATGTVDRTLTLGAVNNIPITFLTPAAGFHCTPLVYYPVGNLVVTDPYYNRDIHLFMGRPGIGSALARHARRPVLSGVRPVRRGQSRDPGGRFLLPVQQHNNLSVYAWL
jgi:hypothetical protein